MNKPTVVLLAGGQSERFWPLPHKMTMTFFGATLLDHMIGLVKAAGFMDIVVVISEALKARIAADDGVKIVMQKGSGQAAALMSSADIIRGKSILVVNADDIVESTLFEKLSAEFGKHNVLVGRRVSQYFPGGYFKLEGEVIREIVEKPLPGREPSSITRLVCDYFTNADTLLSALQKVRGRYDDQYEQALNFLLKTGEQFQLITYSDKWVPLKYSWDTLAATEYFLNTLTKKKIDATAQVDKTATIIGHVVIEKNARVLEYAKLVGPLYIGAGTIVGNHTMVRASHIGENCVIGYNSDVTRSYLGNNVWLHSNYVGDSVLSDDVALGSGTVLANLRFDEAEIHSVVKSGRINTGKNKLGALLGTGVRIGVNASLMPGVKVGAHSIVGAGVVLDKDIPENKRVLGKYTLRIQNNSLPSTDRSAFRNKI